MSIVKAFVFSLVLFAASLFVVSHVRAQARPSSRTQVISADPLGLVESDPFMVQYEWKAGPVYSWALRAFYWPSQAASSGSISAQWSAFGAGAAYRIFVADSRALTGLSVAPAASIFFFNGTNGGSSPRSGIAVRIGGDVAYKWIFDELSVEPMLRFAIGFGPQGALSGGPAVPAYATKPTVIIGLAGGYAW